MRITITESGDIKAVNSVDIKSEVQGRTKIISIVEEGTQITAEDVNNGRVLVRLDSSEIEERLTQQEIRFLNARASLAEAKESLDIQKKQNESDIQQGRMDVRFARMDVEKYLGKAIASRLIGRDSNDIPTSSDIQPLVESKDLGGEARQKLRELLSDIAVKDQDLELASDKLSATVRLYEHEYVSENEKRADELDKQRKQIALQKARTARELFVQYECPK
jgi:multidrug resistance efflux pump